MWMFLGILFILIVMVIMILLIHVYHRIKKIESEVELLKNKTSRNYNYS